MKKIFYKILVSFAIGIIGINYAMASKTIEIVIPVVPGGAVDMTARALSKSLSQHGYESVVVNSPGAYGEIAVRKTLEKKNDVIMVASMANFVFADVRLDRPNEMVKTMQLFGPALNNPMAFYTFPTSKYTSLQEMVKDAKTNEVACAVSNNHGEIILRQINRLYNTKFQPVPYKGTGQLLPNLAGGHVPCAFDQTAPYFAYGDRVKWLGVTTDRADKNLPLVNSVLPNFVYNNWYAAGIPKDSNLLKDEKLVSLLRTWHKDQSLVAPLLNQGFTIGQFQDDLNSRAQRETEIYRKALQK